jgi:DNA-binding NtrC family response regulator
VAVLLIVDDEEVHAQAIARYFSRRGHAPDVVTSAAAARVWLGARRPDLVLLDVRLGDDDGVHLLQEVRQLHPETPVVMMTAYGSIDTAVGAMKAGARDYVQKPIDLEALALIVARAIGEARTRAFAERLQRSQAGWTDRPVLLGRSPTMQRVHEFIARVARFDGLAAGDHATVLLLGETGTGKGLAARVLHQQSALAREPFIALDCTALPRELIEAELFGYERGAFTDAKTAKPGLLEIATGGTLLLDEIGELGLEAQAKLLRVIEEKTIRRIGGLADTRVDVRIVAATNRDLGRAAAEGRFRRDLLYRLNVLTLTLPPLRERGDDVLLLANHYIGVFARKYGRPPKRLSPGADAALVADPWVGNVRELAHVIERAMLLVDGDTIEAGHLRGEPSGGGDGPGLPRDSTLEEMERHLIRRALERSGGNVSLAARSLGVSREVLRYRMRKHGLAAPGGEA